MTHRDFITPFQTSDFLTLQRNRVLQIIPRDLKKLADPNRRASTGADDGFVRTMEACDWVSCDPVAQVNSLETECCIIGLSEKEQYRLVQLQMVDTMSQEEQERLQGSNERPRSEQSIHTRKQDC